MKSSITLCWLLFWAASAFGQKVCAKMIAPSDEFPDHQGIILKNQEFAQRLSFCGPQKDYQLDPAFGIEFTLEVEEWILPGYCITRQIIRKETGIQEPFSASETCIESGDLIIFEAIKTGEIPPETITKTK